MRATELSPPAGSASHPAHAAVLGWYATHGRRLAFRGTRDPWAILVSEVMAQQTQASRAADAWTVFMAAFPTPAALAAASPATVLRAWRGLGYNRRALSLLAAAQRIVAVHGGRVPGDPAALEGLPGVGPYTARAVASLAFGLRVGPVDTNVRRVLSRAFYASQPAERELQAFADAIVPASDPGTWSHALMDVGARFCRSRSPQCPSCPLLALCSFARRQGEGPSGDVSKRRVARSASPFRSTSRWLRGRILDRLRDATDGSWVVFDGPMGEHPVEAILAALERLEAEGLLERHAERGSRARLVTHPGG